MNQQLKKFKTIIWDWNGTLLNDIDLCVDIVNEFLPNHNQKKINKETYLNKFGFPITEYYKKIGIDFEIESFETLTKIFISAYTERVKKCQLQEGANEVLNSFKENEKDQFILTAAHKESVIPLLDHYKINHFFKAIEGLDNYRAESKVDRGHQLIANNKIDKNSTVLIGDTMHDFEVAKALGTHCILISKGHQSKKRLELKASENCSILNNIKELL